MSPVTITTSQAERAQPAHGLGRRGAAASATPMTPAARPSIATRATRLAVGGERLGVRRHRGEIDARRLEQAALPTTDQRAVPRRACAPRPGPDANRSRGGERAARWRRQRARSPAASGCSELRSTAAAAASSASADRPPTGTTSVTAGVPSVSVPVLSSTIVVTRAGALQRFAALDQHADLRASPGRDHHRRRHGQPHRARAGDDQDGDRRRDRADDRAVAAGDDTRSRTSATAMPTTTGTNTALTRSARSWMRRSRAAVRRASARRSATSVLAAPSVVAAYVKRARRC